MDNDNVRENLLMKRDGCREKWLMRRHRQNAMTSLPDQKNKRSTSVDGLLTGTSNLCTTSTRRPQNENDGRNAAGMVNIEMASHRTRPTDSIVYRSQNKLQELGEMESLTRPAPELCTGPSRTFAADGDAPTPGATIRRPPSNFFFDGRRRIDFVLVYEPDGEQHMGKDSEHIYTADGSPQRHCDKRQIFEANLRLLGLELEYASAVHSNTRFVLIHAPFRILLKQAELLSIKMPVHQNDIKKQASIMDGAVNAFLRHFSFLDFDERVKRRIEPVDYFTQPFIEQHLQCFVNYEDEDGFFSSSDRSRMVYDFLIRTRYDNGQKEKFRFGIDRLVQSQTYTAAYPLHDKIDYTIEQFDHETCTDRELLYDTWVRTKNLCKYQPLHLIKEYFGTKIAFYFAWLGYYTRSLYVISFLGFLCSLYGFYTKDNDAPSNDVCDSQGVGANILLCPVCEKYCDFTRLNNSCNYAKITYIFDNIATVLFAVAVSVWTTFFLEGWKRYHAELAYKWNVLDLEAEQEVMRPEFQYLKGKLRTNPVTQQKEPYIPFRTRFLRFAGSFVVVAFFMCLVLALVAGIVVYRIIVMQVFYKLGDESNTIFHTQAVLITSGTAAIINLIFILIMNYFYDMLALKLTELECHRTQTEFDNSYTLKVFLFQFVNFYSSLFYIAFVKGRFSGVPAYTRTDPEFAGVRVFGQRLEDCDPAGCMVELVIQLFIIMVGKQIFNASAEIAYPSLDHWFRRWRLRLPSEYGCTTKTPQPASGSSASALSKRDAQRNRHRMARDGITPLYERDYSLSPVYQQFLFNEYLEMVLQFGFVTLFVAAFPLAPFFALLNNIFEIRLDAYKFVVTMRRPIPAPARNIGVWNTILDLLSNVAVLCNAFVIAFTSDFIPKLHYRFTHTAGVGLAGYVNDSLSYFDARDIAAPQHTDFANITVCRFRDYRRPPCQLGVRDSHGECSPDAAYELQNKWWIILVMRLTFVLVFELFVLSIKAIFAYMIPDMPSKIVLQLQREKYLSRQAILQRSNAFRQDSANRSNKNNDFVDGNLRRSYDVDEVAFQPDEDLVGDDNASVEAAKQHVPIAGASCDVLDINSQECDNFRRMFANRRRPSLSPQAPRRAANEEEAYVIGVKDELTKRNSLAPQSTPRLRRSASPSPTRRLGASQIAPVAPINSSNDSFHSALDKNSPKFLLKNPN